SAEGAGVLWIEESRLAVYAKDEKPRSWMLVEAFPARATCLQAQEEKIKRLGDSAEKVEGNIIVTSVNSSTTRLQRVVCVPDTIDPRDVKRYGRARSACRLSFGCFTKALSTRASPEIPASRKSRKSVACFIPSLLHCGGSSFHCPPINFSFWRHPRASATRSWFDERHSISRPSCPKRLRARAR